jgi:hypothetical protein
MVTINFIRDKEVGMFARAKRLNKLVPEKDTDANIEVEKSE